MVGLIPLCAIVVFEKYQREAVSKIARQAQEPIRLMPELLNGIDPTGEGHRGEGWKGTLPLVRATQLRRLLARLLDEVDICYDPIAITEPKSFHIRIISAIFPTPAISADPGKICGGPSLAWDHE
ncbi:MAG: hypothetical protein ACLP2P_01395 [Desulfobaccales bacterium]